MNFSVEFIFCFSSIWITFLDFSCAVRDETQLNSSTTSSSALDREILHRKKDHGLWFSVFSEKWHSHCCTTGNYYKKSLIVLEFMKNSTFFNIYFSNMLLPIVTFSGSPAIKLLNQLLLSHLNALSYQMFQTNDCPNFVWNTWKQRKRKKRLRIWNHEFRIWQSGIHKKKR